MNTRKQWMRFFFKYGLTKKEKENRFGLRPFIRAHYKHYKNLVIRKKKLVEAERKRVLIKKGG